MEGLLLKICLAITGIFALGAASIFGYLTFQDGASEFGGFLIIMFWIFFFLSAMIWLKPYD